jgi:hypothetical protein
MIKNELVPRIEFNSYTYKEIRTGNGQLIDISCSCDEKDQEKIIEVFKLIRSIDIPITRKNVQHGGYGAYTRYDIEQLKYAGGHGGYIEALYIKDAVDGRCPFVLNKGGGTQDCFIEFKTKDDLLKVWEMFWSKSKDFFENVKKMPGFIRLVKCEGFKPWFYAVGDEHLMRDYTFPEVFGEHPIYRPFVKFVVRDSNGLPTIKTCMGAISYEKETDSWTAGRKKISVTKIYWDDGSSTDSDGIDLTKYVQLLRDDQLWISEAIDKFREMLLGKKTEFEIPFVDGSKFKGRMILSTEKSKNLPGTYSITITTEKDGKRCVSDGELRFKPDDDCLTIKSRIEHDVEKLGRKFISIDSCVRKSSSYTGPWDGVYEI